MSLDFHNGDYCSLFKTGYNFFSQIIWGSLFLRMDGEIPVKFI